MIALWLALVAAAVELPSPESGGNVCLVRPGRMLGSGVRLDVEVDGLRLERMPNRSWQCVDLEPGVHQVRAWGRFAMVEPSFFGVPTIVGWEKVPWTARLRVDEGATTIVHVAIERRGLRLYKASADWADGVRARPVRTGSR